MWTWKCDGNSRNIPICFRQTRFDMPRIFQTQLLKFGADCAWDKLERRLANARALGESAKSISPQEAKEVDWQEFDFKYGRSAGPECKGAILAGFLANGALFSLARNPSQAIGWIGAHPELAAALRQPGLLAAIADGGQMAIDSLMALGLDHRQSKNFADWPGFLHPSESAASDALDEALDAGLLLDIHQRGLGPAWAFSCIKHGDLARLEKICSLGADLSTLSPLDVQEAFAYLALAQGHPGDAFEEKGPTAIAGDDSSPISETGRRKAQIWNLARRHGLAPLEQAGQSATEESTWFPSDSAFPAPWSERNAPAPSSLYLFHAMAAQGELLSRQSIRWWLCARDVPIEPCPLFDRIDPLQWAISRGLPISSAEACQLWHSILAGSDRSGIEYECLSLVQALGWRFDERAFTAAMPTSAQPGSPILLSCFDCAKSEKAMKLALKLGADPLALAGEDSLYAALLSTGNATRASKATQALLQGVRLHGDDDMLKAFIAQKCSDGSLPLHWAARALSRESCELLVQAGADPNALDHKGNHAGHWAAKNHAAAHSDKLVQTIETLTRLGLDWNSLNHSGASAASMMGARAPLAAIEAIANHAPTSMGAKSGKAKSALDKLQIRGGEALSVAEEIIIEAEISGAKKSSKRPAKSL